MTHEQAMHILDMVKEGADYPLSVINYALFLTGDME